MSLLPFEPFVHPEGLFNPEGRPGGAAARWWVVHTCPRAEKRVAREALRLALSYFLPLQERCWRNKRRFLSAYLPLFPQYLFVLADEKGCKRLRRSYLVLDTLHVTDQEALWAELTHIHERMTGGAGTSPDRGLRPGTCVSIVEGPLSGLAGKVARRRSWLSVVVDVEFMRGAVAVEVEPDGIRPTRLPVPVAIAS
jgi:transcriptional antiterminator RfaH